ncbi:sigma 54-interacting transcriptional regulator [Solidesulfovibrio sp.]|uniref:sigma 54-interacting transcriptional regulator n=1 Tax=Solidesulfovibrio sp. TaxID=2910990 RepID=UPI002615865F|nr:sigma 54-interacting transcriptional regulator [Solidesulfovibrio sp.]
MDLAIVRRALACLEPAEDAGRGLDGALSRLLGLLAELPACKNAAVVLADADNPTAIRAQLGAPDVSLLLEAALDRKTSRTAPRVLRRGQPPVAADEAGELACAREEAAMLAAPIQAGLDMPGGWLFADGLAGGDASLADELRLLAVFADVAAAQVRATCVAQERNRELAGETAFLRSKVSLRYRHLFSEGASPRLEALRAAVDQAARCASPVLLLGEDGTGRSVLARLIHELSPRAVRLFSVFSAARTDNPAVELFGGSRGLDTPGVPGLIEETDGGALLVEDAHLLPPAIVERLARFLAEGVFVRVGGSRPRRSRTRVLLKASPQGPSPELAEAAPMAIIRVPTLRERPEDIPALLDHLLSLESVRDARRLSLTPKALKALEAYDWPGNIREMRELVARLAVTAPEDRIDIADIPPEMLAEGERPQVLPEDAAELRDMERQQVLSALTRHGWVQSRAARELGLTLRQIGYRIRKYGLIREGDGPEGLRRG